MAVVSKKPSLRRCGVGQARAARGGHRDLPAARSDLAPRLAGAVGLDVAVVPTRPAVQRVDAGSAPQEVVTVLAGDHVVTGQPEELVAPRRRRAGCRSSPGR